MMLPGTKCSPCWMRIACGTAWNQEIVCKMKKAKAISDRMTTIGLLTKAMNPAHGVRPAAELEQPVDQQRHVEADEQRADLVQHVTLVTGVAQEPRCSAPAVDKLRTLISSSDSDHAGEIVDGAGELHLLDRPGRIDILRADDRAGADEAALPDAFVRAATSWRAPRPMSRSRCCSGAPTPAPPGR